MQKDDDDEFFETREDWSRRKHLVLTYYLTPAAAKFSKASPDGRVMLLDGFAGKGKYADNQPGSPIHLGQLANKCRSWRSPVNLYIYNVEQKDANYASLTACTKGWVDQGIITNLHGAFSQQLPSVLEAAGTSLLFAFLDPFKPKHLPFCDVAPLLTRTAKTELLIVFHSFAVHRLICQVMPSTRTDEGVRQSSMATLDAIFGGTLWRSFLLGALPLNPESVAECYANSLLNACTAAGDNRPAYVCSHAIHARKDIGLKYHVLLFTRHRDGCFLINDAFVKEQGDVAEQARVRSAVGTLFEEVPEALVAPEDNTVRQRRVRDVVIDAAKSQPGAIWSYENLLLKAMSSQFGEFSRTEYNQTTRVLLEGIACPRLIGVSGNKLLNGKWKVDDSLQVRFAT